MIFVLELLLKKRQKKVRDWEKTGKEWVKNHNGSASYAIYSFNDYEQRFPKPLDIKKTIAIVLPMLVAAAILVSFIAYIVTRPPKPVDPNNPHDCSVAVKKGDKVAVSGGDFDGSEGTVVEQRDDCDTNIRLTKSTYSFDICRKSHSEGVCANTKENGTILKVGQSDQLIKL